MKSVFLQQYHMPMLVLLSAVCWMMVGLRAWGFRRSGVPLRTLSGLSTALSITAAVICTTYVLLTVGIFFIDQNIYNIYDGVAAANISASDCARVVRYLKTLFQLAGACRLLLLLVIWAVKAGILAIYMQTVRVVSPFVRAVIHGTGPVLALTLVAALWLAIQSMAISLLYPTSVDVRDGDYVAGVTFIQLTDEVEVATSLLNLVTDVLLIFIGLKTIRALRCSVASGWPMLVMGGITVTVAFLRLVFVSISWAASESNESLLTRIETPVYVLAELEALAAVVVSTLPGVRAVIRATDDGSERLESERLESERLAANTPASTGKTESYGYGGWSQT